MAAYIIVRIRVSDPEGIQPYQAAVPPLVERYGGRFIVRGGEVITLEGPEESRRVVVMEFPDRPAAEAFYHSPEYREARELRAGMAEAEFILVDGVE